MVPILIVGVLIVVGAIVLVIIGFKNPMKNDDSILQSRLEELSQKGEQINLEQLELSQPFSERVIYPLARLLGELAIRFTPQNALVSISRKLELAGSPSQLDPTLFLSLQFFGALGFGGLILAVFRLKESPAPLSEAMLYALGFGLLGFYFPQLWLGSKIARRQKGIRKAMPDALDLLTICVEAGLGFDAAMAKVSEKWQTELSMAFARVIQEVQLGKLRREAMRDMAERIGIPEMTSFVAAIIQSEQLGVSMAKVLHIQADQMRMKRRQYAEEEAHKAPLKMLIPMTLLIFPSLGIVLMTPAALRLLNSGLGAMFGI
jgi:tight adherence protein C